MTRVLTTFFLLSIVCALHAQTYDDLIKSSDTSLTAYYSPMSEERAKTISAHCEKTIQYISGLVGFKPKITLLILNQEHWKKYAPNHVYGMPHGSKGVLVVASEDNDFWRSFIPPLDKLPADLSAKIKQAYTTKDGTLSMMAFFDLLALHELGHEFHIQGGLTMQRSWLQELFCNIMLHTYVAEAEPENLAVLEIFPQMVVASGTNGLSFTTLSDFEKNYGKMNPRNYGWYQCKLHVAAKKIYNAGGKKTFLRLWSELKRNTTEMTDEQLLSFLNTQVSKEVAKEVTDW